MEPPLEESRLSPWLPTEIPEDQKRMVFDQYKILVDSINNSNIVRESSHNFWIAINGFALTGAAYIKDLETLPFTHKAFILWTVIGVGLVICVSWLNFLITLKRTIDIRNEVLVELEKYFPVKVFTFLFGMADFSTGKNSLTIRQMFVPLLFIVGYLFFAAILFLYPEEVVLPHQS